MKTHIRTSQHGTQNVKTHRTSQHGIQNVKTHIRTSQHGIQNVKTHILGQHKKLKRRAAHQINRGRTQTKGFFIDRLLSIYFTEFPINNKTILFHRLGGYENISLEIINMCCLFVL